MKNCITCLFQGDNSVNDNGEGNVFCMVDCKWRKEQDVCTNFVEYADLSKEIRYNYAAQKSGNNFNIKTLIKYNWYLTIATLIIAFILFLILIKFFDKYLF